MPNPRLGFCCKFLPEDGGAKAARQMNTTTVTMAYLGRLDPKAAYDKLATVVAHNLEAIIRQIAHVASRPKLERLHRLSSDLLPGYTHPSCQGFYGNRDLRNLSRPGSRQRDSSRGTMACASACIPVSSA